MQKLLTRKRNKGFTLIELIVVIAVIGILVLLAMPKLLNYTKDAKETKAMHDVKVVEQKVEEYLIRHNDKLPTDLPLVDETTINDAISDGRLYDETGVVAEVGDGPYYIVDTLPGMEDVKINKDGTLIADNRGNVYLVLDEAIRTNVCANQWEEVATPDEMGMMGRLFEEMYEADVQIKTYLYDNNRLTYITVQGTYQGFPMEFALGLDTDETINMFIDDWDNVEEILIEGSESERFMALEDNMYDIWDTYIYLRYYDFDEEDTIIKGQPPLVCNSIPNPDSDTETVYPAVATVIIGSDLEGALGRIGGISEIGANANFADYKDRLNRIGTIAGDQFLLAKIGVGIYIIPMYVRDSTEEQKAIFGDYDYYFDLDEYIVLNVENLSYFVDAPVNWDDFWGTYDWDNPVVEWEHPNILQDEEFKNKYNEEVGNFDLLPILDNY